MHTIWLKIYVRGIVILIIFNVICFVPELVTDKYFWTNLFYVFGVVWSSDLLIYQQ